MIARTVFIRWQPVLFTVFLVAGLTACDSRVAPIDVAAH